MSNSDIFITDPEDFNFSFSDGISPETIQRLQSALAKGENEDLIKRHAANVLIGNIPVRRLNENVGETFILHGFHMKNVTFKDSERNGKYIILFGVSKGQPVAYSSTSDKVYEALAAILYIYGGTQSWQEGINVKIRMDSGDNFKAYSLEVV